MNKKSISIYQVFVRNHTKEGTFAALEKDLNRIASMGFDFLYLMPVHPISRLDRKGTLGSPYAIADYNAVDSSLGTMDDFQHLIHKAHEAGLNVMMDIVIHHSGRDHIWVKEHPEYYYHDKQGRPAAAVEEWSDVYDFNYDNKELQEKLIAMLQKYVKMGIDGYRCDVASLVPLSFWKKAVRSVNKMNPDFVWLAESVDEPLISDARARNLPVMSDSETAQVFDLLYPYDIRPEFNDALKTKQLEGYEKMVNFTMDEYPSNIRKVIYLENHDVERVYSCIGSKEREKNWLAYSFLMQGCAFVYAGQEAYARKQPSLFDEDKVDWKDLDHSMMRKIQRLNELRHQLLPSVRSASLKRNSLALEFVEYAGEKDYHGVFNVNGEKGDIPVSIANGSYTNLINGRKISVRNGSVRALDCPMLLETEGHFL